MQNVSYKTLFTFFYSIKGKLTKSQQLVHSLEKVKDKQLPGTDAIRASQKTLFYLLEGKTANHVNFMQSMLNFMLILCLAL